MGFSYVDFIINNKELAAICKKYNIPVDIKGDVVKARCFPDEGLPETYYGNRENELGNIALWFANVIVEGVFESDDDFNDASEAIKSKAEELSRATIYSKYKLYFADEDDGCALYYLNEKQNGEIKIIDVICDDPDDEIFELVLADNDSSIEKYAATKWNWYLKVENDKFWGDIKNITTVKPEKKLTSKVTPKNTSKATKANTPKTTKDKAKKIDAKNETTGDKTYPTASPLDWFEISDGWLKGFASGLLVLDDVVIPDCVEHIDEWAFQNGAFSTLYIPDSVKSIGEFAFFECTNLKTIIISDSVTSIGECAFNNTAYFNRSANWKNGVLYICNHLIDAKNSISGDYTIKADTKTIADYAFYGCKKLSSVNIPDSVVSIGEEAFGDCENLIIRGAIDSYAEKYANDNGFVFEVLLSAAKSKTAKKSTAKAKEKKEEKKEKLVRGMIKKIGECKSKPIIENKNFVLTMLSTAEERKITTYITERGGIIRSSTVLDTDYIIIADGDWDGVSKKSERALELNTTRDKNIKALTETDFWRFMSEDEDDDDEYDENYSLDDEYDEYDEYDDEYITVAEAIEKISAIEEDLKTLAAEADAMAKEAEKREKEEKKKAQANKPKKKPKKTDFYIEDGELRAYHGNAEVVVIPDGVRVIAEYGLSEAEFVTEIIISESVEIIRDEAFVGTSITSIEIPASVKEIGEGVFNFCELLENISVSENNENYCSVKGALYTKDKKKLIAFPEVITQEKQETPSFVTEIGGFAFGRVNNIKELTITDNVVNLSEKSFSNINSLEKVVFGKNVKSVPENAFNRDWKLEKVVLNDGLEFIGKEAFAFCDIKEITIPGTVETIGEKAFENNRPLEKVVINEGVKSIGARCFAACGKLEEVYLPKSLEKIRVNAFQSTRSLKTIYIPEDSPAIESVRKLAEKAGIAVMTTSAVSNNSTVKSTQKSPISTVNGSASPEQLQSEIDNLRKEIASLEGSKKKATGAKFGRVLAIIFIILGVVFALLGETVLGAFEIIVSILILVGTSSSIGDAKEHNKKIDGEIQKKRAKLNELQKQNGGK